MRNTPLTRRAPCRNSLFSAFQRNVSELIGDQNISISNGLVKVGTPPDSASH
jgi:hypothetical protein